MACLKIVSNLQITPFPPTYTHTRTHAHTRTHTYTCAHFHPFPWKPHWKMFTCQPCQRELSHENIRQLVCRRKMPQMLYCFHWIQSVYVSNRVVKRVLPSATKEQQHGALRFRPDPLVGTDLRCPGVPTLFASH